MRAGDPRAGHDRESDWERATSTIAGQLTQRGVRVADDDGGEALADLLSAVERFETEVARRGGDSYSNMPDDPDDPAFVLPVRADAESIRDYTARVRRAAEELGRTRP